MTNRMIIASHEGPLGMNDTSFALGVSKTTFTDAQIKAAPGGANTEGLTEVLPAPGVDKIIIPLQIITRSNFAAAYTNIGDGAQLAFVIGASIADYAVVSRVCRDNVSANRPQDVLGQASDRCWRWGQSSRIQQIGESTAYADTPESIDEAVGLNQPLQFYAYNPDGNFTGGDPSNVWEITVVYAIVDI